MKRKMQGGWPQLSFRIVILIGVTVLLQLYYTTAVPVDASHTTHRYNIYFGKYASPNGPVGNTEKGAAASMTARYVQLSNGSRFACETTDSHHHDPLTTSGLPLNVAMQSLIDSIKGVGAHCTNVVYEQYSTVLCWDREVRLDVVAAQMRRVLGRRSSDEPHQYWDSNDSFGPYVATTYGNGDECLYKKQPTETEIRLYCRYNEFDNPIPFLTLHEESQCHFVLRVMASQFCYIPQLDHAIETETVHCRMLD